MYKALVLFQDELRSDEELTLESSAVQIFHARTVVIRPLPTRLKEFDKTRFSKDRNKQDNIENICSNRLI